MSELIEMFRKYKDTVDEGMTGVQLMLEEGRNQDAAQLMMQTCESFIRITDAFMHHAEVTK